MARSPRARVSIGNTTPKKEADTDFKSSRTTQKAARRQKYKHKKLAQQIHAVNAEIEAADVDADSRKAARARKGKLYRDWKPRGQKKVVELERVVEAQRAEIEELKRLAQGGAVPRLEPVVATPRRNQGKGGEEEEEDQMEEEADSSPVKIQQQLMEDVVAASPNPAGLEDVVQGATVTTTIEKEVAYPTLPSVEAEEVSEAVEEVNEGSAQAPLKKSKKEVIRESSADTNAGTPRNIRRSPRKRTVKRKSVGGL